ncbi:hypothetical protein C8J57DRAFT_1470549 [Mycena rebaudengoi]|nr:hypothetical protein C8J57DRAFT_1470549 [Mycena rebaudengoi]
MNIGQNLHTEQIYDNLCVEIAPLHPYHVGNVILQFRGLLYGEKNPSARALLVCSGAAAERLQLLPQNLRHRGQPLSLLVLVLAAVLGVVLGGLRQVLTRIGRERRERREHAAARERRRRLVRRALVYENTQCRVPRGAPSTPRPTWSFGALRPAAYGFALSPCFRCGGSETDVATAKAAYACAAAGLRCLRREHTLAWARWQDGGGNGRERGRENHEHVEEDALRNRRHRPMQLFHHSFSSVKKGCTVRARRIWEWGLLARRLVLLCVWREKALAWARWQDGGGNEGEEDERTMSTSKTMPLGIETSAGAALPPPMRQVAPAIGKVIPYRDIGALREHLGLPPRHHTGREKLSRKLPPKPPLPVRTPFPHDAPPTPSSTPTQFRGKRGIRTLILPPGRPYPAPAHGEPCRLDRALRLRRRTNSPQCLPGAVTCGGRTRRDGEELEKKGQKNSQWTATNAAGRGNVTTLELAYAEGWVAQPPVWLAVRCGAHKAKLWSEEKSPGDLEIRAL